MSRTPETVWPDEAPAFREPWQAQAFALAVQASAAGLFTWSEWTAALGAEIARDDDAAASDPGEAYWHDWLAALERLVESRLAAPAPR